MNDDMMHKERTG